MLYCIGGIGSNLRINLISYQVDSNLQTAPLSGVGGMTTTKSKGYACDQVYP